MNGAAHYDHYVAPFVRPYTAATLAALADCEPRHVLDHGAGTGAVTGAFHQRFPACQVTAVDPNASMLERFWRHPNIDPRRVAVVCGTIADVDDAARFDAICSQLVFMFVSDVDAELRRLRYHAADDARLVVSVLRGATDVIPFAAYWNAAASVIPGLLDAPDYPHFRFADGAGLGHAIEHAGWAPPELTTVTSWREIEGEELWTWIHGALPLLDASGVALGALSDSTRTEVRHAFLGEVARYAERANRYRLPLHGWQFTSRAI